MNQSSTGAAGYWQAMLHLTVGTPEVVHKLSVSVHECVTGL